MVQSMKRKLVTIITSAAFALPFAAASTAFANPKVLVDIKTGRVLYHEDAFQRWYPASLTKLMTTYVVFRALAEGRVTLETPVVMSKLATSQKPSKMPFKTGDRLTLDAALKILLVKSANDVAVALGETVGGNLPNFISMMNAEAQRIGMTSSRFINPNGMPGAGQYVTARDLAVLTVRLRQEFPQYAGYFALEGFVNGTKKYNNYNMLIGRFNGADGMKTGFICASGFNLVGTATVGGRSVAAIVLGADSLGERTDAAANLLQQGLSGKVSTNYSLNTLPPYGENRNQVADIRAEICNPQAAKVRSEGRDEAGRMKLTSPYIHEMNREPRYVEANLLPPQTPQLASSNGGMAQGDGGPDLARIPIPRERPRP